MGPRPPERQIQLRLQIRERRPQLVARVVDHPPLSLDGRFEAIEHPVEASTESRELVTGLGDRQSSAWIDA